MVTRFARLSLLVFGENAKMMPLEDQQARRQILPGPNEDVFFNRPTER